MIHSECVCTTILGIRQLIRSPMERPWSVQVNLTDKELRLYTSGQMDGHETDGVFVAVGDAVGEPDPQFRLGNHRILPAMLIINADAGDPPGARRQRSGLRHW